MFGANAWESSSFRQTVRFGFEKCGEPRNILFQSTENQEGTVLEPGAPEWRRGLHCTVAVSKRIAQYELARPNQRLARFRERDFAGSRCLEQARCQVDPRSAGNQTAHTRLRHAILKSEVFVAWQVRSGLTLFFPDNLRCGEPVHRSWTELYNERIQTSLVVTGNNHQNVDGMIRSANHPPRRWIGFAARRRIPKQVGTVLGQADLKCRVRQSCRIGIRSELS